MEKKATMVWFIKMFYMCLEKNINHKKQIPGIATNKST